jgi:hypothetical protein
MQDYQRKQLWMMRAFAILLFLLVIHIMYHLLPTYLFYHVLLIIVAWIGYLVYEEMYS